jgi:hypothetical protein
MNPTGHKSKVLTEWVIGIRVLARNQTPVVQAATTIYHGLVVRPRCVPENVSINKKLYTHMKQRLETNGK